MKKNSTKIFSIYLDYWISIKLTANNITSTVRETPDRNLPEIRENLLPAVKSEIQIREKICSRETQKINPQSAKLNSRENFMPHGIDLLRIVH